MAYRTADVDSGRETSERRLRSMCRESGDESSVEVVILDFGVCAVGIGGLYGIPFRPPASGQPFRLLTEAAEDVAGLLLHTVGTVGRPYAAVGGGSIGDGPGEAVDIVLDGRSQGVVIASEGFVDGGLEIRETNA